MGGRSRSPSPRGRDRSLSPRRHGDRYEQHSSRSKYRDEDASPDRHRDRDRDRDRDHDRLHSRDYDRDREPHRNGNSSRDRDREREQYGDRAKQPDRSSRWDEDKRNGFKDDRREQQPAQQADWGRPPLPRPPPPQQQHHRSWVRYPGFNTDPPQDIGGHQWDDLRAESLAEHRRQKRIRMWQSDYWTMWRNSPSPPPPSDDDETERVEHIATNSSH